MRTPGVPSGTNPLGLVKHLARVERFVLLGQDTRDGAGTFHAGPGETTAGVV